MYMGEYYKIIMNILKQNIKSGTTIISDCWKAYVSQGSEDFTHLTVNHYVNFVHPDFGANTNNNKSTCRSLKKSLPKNKTKKKNLYDSYFSHYCIKKSHLSDSALEPAMVLTTQFCDI